MQVRRNTDKRNRHRKPEDHRPKHGVQHCARNSHASIDGFLRGMRGCIVASDCVHGKEQAEQKCDKRRSYLWIDSPRLTCVICELKNGRKIMNCSKAKHG